MNFENENLIVNYKDYYFSNVIARSSKTMVECNNSKIDLKNWDRRLINGIFKYYFSRNI